MRFCADRIVGKQRPRQIYANGQIHQSLRCSHTQRMDVYTDIAQILCFKHRWIRQRRRLTLCIRETHKRVPLQTMKTQIKCSIMLHFIRVYTVCKGKKDLRQKNTLSFQNYNLTPLDVYNGPSEVYCIKP